MSYQLSVDDEGGGGAGWWKPWDLLEEFEALELNWDRQKVPKLQLFLLFPLHRGSGGFRQKSVCVCPRSAEPKSGWKLFLGVDRTENHVKYSY